MMSSCLQDKEADQFIVLDPGHDVPAERICRRVSRNLLDTARLSTGTDMDLIVCRMVQTTHS
jgi:hypothetical protein